ncbi:Methyltransferase domain-containing protein [Jatrophihabitans endophyticus]|uniref:Methyltransferase domain-containing protein n=1 Tax=Jatrophihabitans endophyticus TaxID=1206085 RepID=A0A1M5CXF8_9ACTN|nr:class I SAM-dependent methyltransferase [Jatrophihabitans endophyticus]SHF59389.1 Methyltransferase domain-containing protein [Jatrophihabitans endophyticus]
MTLDGARLTDLYRHRFGDEQEARTELWQVLCHDFFQRWVAPTDTVLDVAAGHCEFANAIVAERRIALDLNPAVREHAGPGVEAVVGRSDAVPLADGEVDTAFVSNFFEHVDRDTILATLVELRRVLRPGGRLLILQPNIRFCARDYWQFFDHVTPVDDRALAEALAATGFELQHCIPRFLPYTTKGRLPATPALVRLYLRVPVAWRVLGAQSFLVATTTASTPTTPDPEPGEREEP